MEKATLKSYQNPGEKAWSRRFEMKWDPTQLEKGIISEAMKQGYKDHVIPTNHQPTNQPVFHASCHLACFWSLLNSEPTTKRSDTFHWNPGCVMMGP